MIQHALQDIRVVDLTSYIAGSYTTALLADMGARVVKVESPTGDRFRALAGFDGWNRGKRAIALNLNTHGGKALLHEMIRDGDVLAMNLRPGVAGALGVDYDSVARVNPRIVYSSVTSYGNSGPYRDKPAFDPLMQAQSGAMAAQGRAEPHPVLLRVPITDYAGAILAASGIAMALYHRKKTGRGQRIEASLADSVLAFQVAEFFSYPGKPWETLNDSNGIGAAYRIYEAKDGWLFISCDDDESWSKLCRVLNRPDLSQSYGTEEKRRASSQELIDALEPVFRKATLSDWLNRLERAGLKRAPVRSSRDVHDEPQALHNALSVDVQSPILGPIKQLGLPVKMSKTPGKIWGTAPTLGQHTDEILSEMGRSPEEIADLRAKGVVF